MSVARRIGRNSRSAGIRAAAVLALTTVSGSALAQARLPADFVHLRSVDPSIAQDIRYAGANNFVGRPLDGYAAPECILRRDAAAALKRVQTDLAATGYALKVYDCYRPERAVRAMVRWAKDTGPDGAAKRFYPRLPRRSLLAGYIAAKSRHSTGTAVDLTLVSRGEVGAPPAAPTAAAPTAAAPCTAPAAQRGDGESIDMGTGFDCFDRNSHSNARDIGAQPRQRRAVLAAAMRKHGFHGYYREWWHFSYGGAAPLGYYDFPVR
jgi:D-alanyl-D-alanine dipeptidase